MEIEKVKLSEEIKMENSLQEITKIMNQLEIESIRAKKSLFIYYLKLII